MVHKRLVSAPAFASVRYGSVFYHYMRSVALFILVMAVCPLLLQAQENTPVQTEESQPPDDKPFAVFFHGGTSMASRQSYALGGSLGVEFHLPTRLLGGPFTVGPRFGMWYNLDNIFSMEGAAMMRWYSPPQPYGEAFLQGAIGVTGLIEEPRTRSSFLVEFGGGIRLHIGESFYLEQLLRIGWPYIWGGGVVLGYRFNVPKRARAQPAGPNGPFMPDVPPPPPPYNPPPNSPPARDRPPAEDSPPPDGGPQRSVTSPDEIVL